MDTEARRQPVRQPFLARFPKDLHQELADKARKSRSNSDCRDCASAPPVAAHGGRGGGLVRVLHNHHQRSGGRQEKAGGRSLRGTGNRKTQIWLTTLNQQPCDCNPRIKFPIIWRRIRHRRLVVGQGPAAKLRELVRRCIEKHIDKQQFELLKITERTERELLIKRAAVVEGWGAA